VIQYEDQGLGTQVTTGCSVEPVTTVLPCNSHTVCVVSLDSRHHQHRESAALLSEGHTPPSVMYIDSPHETASEGNENSLRDALSRSLYAQVT